MDGWGVQGNGQPCFSVQWCIMNSFFRLGLVMGGATLLCQCAMVHSIDRSDPSAWNEGLVWRRQPGTAKDYVPIDFQRPAVAGPGRGEWVVDPQDGYRFFVPTAGTKKFSQYLLLAEANKATNNYTSGNQKALNTAKAMLFPIFAFTPLWDSNAREGGGGCDSGGSSPDPIDTSSSSTNNCRNMNSSGHDSGRCMSGSSGGGHGK